MSSKMRRIVKLTVLSLFVLILAVVGGGLVYRAYRHHEIDRATVIDQVMGIDEESGRSSAASTSRPGAKLIAERRRNWPGSEPRQIPGCRVLAIASGGPCQGRSRRDCDALRPRTATVRVGFEMGRLCEVDHCLRASISARRSTGTICRHSARKELVLIQNAGHNVMTLKSDEFLGLLVQRVRPLATQSP
jgi:hypothetical protein